MKNQTKSFSIRLEEPLLQEMDEYKEKNGINWSAKIRNFIKAEMAQQVSIDVKPKTKSKPKIKLEPVIQDEDEDEDEDEEIESPEDLQQALDLLNSIESELQTIDKKIIRSGKISLYDQRRTTDLNLVKQCTIDYIKDFENLSKI